MSRRARAARLLSAIAIGALAGCIQGSQLEEHPVEGDPERGRVLALRWGCGACHIIPGVEDAEGLAGPPLTDWAARQYIAGALYNQPDALVAWIVDPQAIEPGTAMPTLGIPEDEALHIAAYLYTLGDSNPLGPPHPLPEPWLGKLGHWRQVGPND